VAYWIYIGASYRVSIHTDGCRYYKRASMTSFPPIILACGIESVGGGGAGRAGIVWLGDAEHEARGFYRKKGN